MIAHRRQWIAYLAPFGVFMAFLGLISLIKWVAPSASSLWLTDPQYWVFPLQTIVCAAVLIIFWREYDFGKLSPWPLGLAAGLLALAIWISPQWLFGATPRTEGFNPTTFGATGALFFMTVAARFARLVIIVPLLEEIFWRGFLMRYLIKEDFTAVRFGSYTALSFFGVAVLFMLGHNPPDYAAAFLTGLIYNGVAIKTKSLWACVLAHAVTNLGLGIYIMATGQWGFW